MGNQWQENEKSYRGQGLLTVENEQQQQRASLEKVDWEESVLLIAEDVEGLLYAEQDEEHSGHHEERNGLATAPCPLHSSKVNAHNQSCQRTDEKDDAHPVDVLCLLLGGGIWKGLK